MLVRIAELIEIEQFGRQRFAAGVTLTLVLVDVDFQFSGHFSLPSVARGLARADCFLIFMSAAQPYCGRR
jgi:hypothetical protein